MFIVCCLWARVMKWPVLLVYLEHEVACTLLVDLYITDLWDMTPVHYGLLFILRVAV